MFSVLAGAPFLKTKETMDVWTVMTSLSAAFAAIGGVEVVKFFLSRKQYARKAEAEADSAEFAVLRETVDFLQTQLKEKEERFAEQTRVVRELNVQVLNLTNEKAKVELELQRYKCVRKGCAQREPQNGY